MNKKNLLSIVFVLLITGSIFFKIPFKNLYPVPGDLLVSFYFPFYSGGWEGYDPWTTHKEQFGADAIRQIYLWKEFATSQLREGKFPLWNPYTFSGQPLAANFQASVYYPLNIFYFLTDPKNAWIILIVIQPFLAGIFMYLAARSFKLSRVPSMFAATAFMFSSYVITWMENGNIVHSYLWLPLAIWSINEYFRLFRLRFILVLIVSLTLSIFGGHPQTVIYLYMVSTIYWVYKTMELNKRKLPLLLTALIGLIFPLLISGIQIIPTADFYRQSPISLPFAAEVFDRAILPYQNLVTFFAVDFFGHPASKNFWSQTYGDFTPYIGVLPIIFALWATVTLWKEKFIKFATIVSAFFIIAAVNSPITWAIKTFEIPLINSTTPSRFVSLSIFFLAILAGFGLADFLDNFKKQAYLVRFFKFLVSIGVIYLMLWAFAFVGQLFLKPTDTWKINLAVTRRNLIIPTAMFIFLPSSILLVNFLSSKVTIIRNWSQAIIIAGIFTITLYGGLFFSNKFLPASPRKFIFPEHLLFNWLKENASIDRFYGQGTARVDFNFPVHYQVYVAEGYDTLRFKRYAELLTAGRNDGIVPESYLRSDAAFEDYENGFRKRLFELLGVKYLLDKEDTPKTGKDFNPGKFAPDNVVGHVQFGKFLIYRREDVVPRVFLTTNYQVIADDSKIIQKIFDPDFNLKTIILEKESPINLDLSNTDIIEPKIIKYEPNKAVFETNANYNALLFLSDAHDNNWQVYIDNQQSELLRAHYALRAVAVPKGKHQVIFKYKPQSFTYGLVLTSASVLLLILISSYFIYRKRF